MINSQNVVNFKKKNIKNLSYICKKSQYIVILNFK